MKKTAAQRTAEFWDKYQQNIHAIRPIRPTCGKPKKYPEGTTKKTYCLPTHKFEQADRAIKKLLDRYAG